MTCSEVLNELESLGQESIKKILIKHGCKEPLFGVKIEELKKILKKIKANHQLALELYATGNYDAMYLAGLIAEPEKMSKKELQNWVEKANAPTLNEYTVAWVASESKHGLEMALEWIKNDDEGIASTGWSTLSNLVAIKNDSEIDIQMIKNLLVSTESHIHNSKNRVTSAMNGFVIAVGCHVKELNPIAKEIAIKNGKITVDVGDTKCKVPYALDYIEKVEGKNAVGKKKKSARC